MNHRSHPDRWLLPSRQREYPGRPLLPPATLHGRRESTFLLLSATFLVAAATLPLLGPGLVDLPAVAARLGLAIELPAPAYLSLGVLAFPLTFLAGALIAELYGGRRALALVGVGLVAGLALVGLIRLAAIAPGAGAAPGATSLGLALVGGYLAAHLVHLTIFAILRRRREGRQLWLRTSVAALAGLLAGWMAFALLAPVIPGAAQAVDPASRAAAAPFGLPALDAFALVAVTAWLYSAAVVLLASGPLHATARGLAVYLRVGPHGDDDALDRVDDLDGDPRDAEAAFFAAGDRLDRDAAAAAAGA
jgi:uncharacterized PurR-regulated membrane protein YhhQ (DUF165 family)